jgi:diguanylate cyclase (GGDEF)-like protein
MVREYCVYNGSLLNIVIPEVIVNRVYIFNIVLTFGFLWVVSLLFSLEVYYMQHHLESENISLEKLANYDPLTKLMNRRSMDIFLKDAIEKAEQKKEVFCIIMADIDDFKKVNDTYGHAAGDMVLEETAKIIIDNVRDEDCVCRWGGEEIVILIRSEAETAKNVAQRICKDIAATRLDIGPVKLAITITLGVTQYQSGDDIESVVERADRYMYTGKKRGKNQIVYDQNQ